MRVHPCLYGYLRAESAAIGAVVLTTSLFVSLGCAPPPPAGLSPAPEGTPSASIAHVFEGKGYVEAEYFLNATANAYREVGTWGLDGRWTTEVARADQPFVTRLMVQRPADPARFNGTVWVEWLNVTAGADGAVTVVQARDWVIASGAAWVGVSAQKAGVDNLKLNPSGRYAALSVASDALSYDIFAQAARAVREHPETLGGAPAQRLVAVGDSQSALRLATYVNAVHQLDPVFDAVIIHSRFTSGAPIGDGIMAATRTRIRQDAIRPVLQLQTEVEVGLNLDPVLPGLGQWADVRQPDEGNVHTWEVTGGAHVDTYLLSSAGGDPSAPVTFPGCAAPMNDFPFHYAANAAFAGVEHWIESGQRLPSTPPIETVAGLIQRDADGNARGGLRLPDIDLPLSQYNGAVDWGNVLCAMPGTSAHFAPEALRARYGSVAEYVAAYESRADAAVSARIMTPADRDAAVAAAASAPIPSP